MKFPLCVNFLRICKSIDPVPVSSSSSVIDNDLIRELLRVHLRDEDELLYAIKKYLYPNWFDCGSPVLMGVRLVIDLWHDSSPLDDALVRSKYRVLVSELCVLLSVYSPDDLSSHRAMYDPGCRIPFEDLKLFWVLNNVKYIIRDISNFIF
jgi:hypothetical protein